jgi:hypothetical protein
MTDHLLQKMKKEQVVPKVQLLKKPQEMTKKEGRPNNLQLLNYGKQQQPELWPRRR